MRWPCFVNICDMTQVFHDLFKAHLPLVIGGRVYGPWGWLSSQDHCTCCHQADLSRGLVQIAALSLNSPKYNYIGSVYNRLFWNFRHNKLKCGEGTTGLTSVPFPTTESSTHLHPILRYMEPAEAMTLRLFWPSAKSNSQSGLSPSVVSAIERECYRDLFSCQEQTPGHQDVLFFQY